MHVYMGVCVCVGHLIKLLIIFKQNIKNCDINFNFKEILIFKSSLKKPVMIMNVIL